MHSETFYTLTFHYYHFANLSLVSERDDNHSVNGHMVYKLIMNISSVVLGPSKIPKSSECKVPRSSASGGLISRGSTCGSKFHEDLTAMGSVHTSVSGSGPV